MGVVEQPVDVAASMLALSEKYIQRTDELIAVKETLIEAREKLSLVRQCAYEVMERGEWDSCASRILDILDN